MNMTPSEEPLQGSHLPSSLGTAPVAQGDLFHALQNERRRLVLRCLRARDEPVEVSVLVEQVGALEAASDEVSEADRQRIRVDLLQSQLPKLDQLGFVDYDAHAGVVTPTGALSTATAYLADAPDVAATPTVDQSAESVLADQPAESATGGTWLRYYTAATSVSALLVGLAVFGPVVAISLSFKVAAALVAGIHAVLTAGLFVDRVTSSHSTRE
ncbi:DUF7344 domain-containing protein [Halorarius litoreus]|uniref:DUF7344 domain-containing protein n=1 Tax=Halorarius litoreus TaxID=2962676 RepID=UPI0020CC0EEC|nr:hypothetical protein [Halorarius litoreus]